MIELEYSDEQHAEDITSIIVGELGYKYRLIEGVAMPPYITPRQYQVSRRVITKPSDICFTAYPKSGSTWLSYILILLTGKRGSSLRDSFHWMESTWTNRRSEEEVENAPSPRIFKSHMPYSMALGGVPEANLCRYIYIARNPKDVCVSYYKFEFGKSWAGYYEGDWDHWQGKFMKGEVQYGDWFDHVLSWWEHRDSRNILFLKYEDLKSNPVAEVQKIAAFLEIDITEAALADINENITFRSMKANEFCGPGDLKEYKAFFRKGEIGSWTELFTDAQSREFDKLYEERIAPSGLSFQFG